MAFLIHSVSDGHVPPFEYIPAGNITPKAGLALRLTGGKVVVAAGTTAPTHICMLEGNTAHGSYENERIPVIRIEEGITFGTTNAVDFSAVKEGDSVTLSADGLSLTATKTGGIAQVVGLRGTEIGSDIQVRFHSGV